MRHRLGPTCYRVRRQRARAPRRVLVLRPVVARVRASAVLVRVVGPRAVSGWAWCPASWGWRSLGTVWGSAGLDGAFHDLVAPKMGWVAGSC